VHKVVDMSLVKEVFLYTVNFGSNAKEPQNKGVTATAQGPKLVNNTFLHFLFVNGQIIGPQINEYVVLPGQYISDMALVVHAQR